MNKRFKFKLRSAFILAWALWLPTGSVLAAELTLALNGSSDY